MTEPPPSLAADTTAPEGEPGYCTACAGCIATRRLDPPEEGPRHACNTSDRHKPGHPEYRRCTCGQRYHSGGGYWYKVSRPPVHWLREHGMDPGEFRHLQDDDTGPRLFEEFHARKPTLLTLPRWLFRN